MADRPRTDGLPLPDRELDPCRLPDGRLLTAAEFGSATGRPVVVLDGAGSRLQGRLAHELGRARDIRIITPDRPGSYGSTPHERATFTTVADDLRHLLDCLDLSRVGVLAMSGGTGFGCTFAARHADVVSRVGLLGPIAPIEHVGGARGMDATTRLGFTLGARAPWLLERMISMMRWQTRRDPVRAARQFTRMRPPPDRDVIEREDVWPILLASFPDVTAGPAAAAHEFTLMTAPWPIDPARIEAPTRVWAGGADTVHPPHHAEWLAARIPRAELQVRPGVAIFGWLDDYPDLFAWVAGPPSGHPERPSSHDPSRAERPDPG